MKLNIQLINLLKDDNKVKFEYYEEGTIWMSVFCGERQEYLLFPVYIENLGSTRFMKEDKALYQIKHIKFALERNEMKPMI